MPLWHEAWPKKDFKMMKDLLPQARAGVAKVAEARLPGILREKQAAWDQGVVGLKDALARYEAAAASGSEPGLLDAVEALHSRYEGLVRVTRPPMKELDAFHVALYRVYHHDLAAQAWPAVAASAGDMATACQALAAAPLPKRFASREAEVRPEIGALCAKSDRLKTRRPGPTTRPPRRPSRRFTRSTRRSRGSCGSTRRRGRRGAPARGATAGAIIGALRGFRRA